MATVTSKVFARTAAATSSTTLYTVPSATTAVITDIFVTNTATTQATFTLSLDGVIILSANSINPNSSVSITMKQVLATTKILAGLASATSVNFHISGVEIV